MITIKYYYNLAPPEVTVTIAGGVLILAALLGMKYLKINSNGFNGERLLTSKWDYPDLIAFVAAQTMGGHALKETDLYKGKEGSLVEEGHRENFDSC